MPLTPRLVGDFAANFLYVELHGAGGAEAKAGDTLRGQIREPPPVFSTGTIPIVKSTSPAGATGCDFTHDIPGSARCVPPLRRGAWTFVDVVEGTYTIMRATRPGAGSR